MGYYDRNERRYRETLVDCYCFQCNKHLGHSSILGRFLSRLTFRAEVSITVTREVQAPLYTPVFCPKCGDEIFANPYRIGGRIDSRWLSHCPSKCSVYPSTQEEIDAVDAEWKEVA